MSWFAAFMKKPRIEIPLGLMPAARWTPIDRDRLANFLQSDSGKKLIARMRSTEARNAINGAQDVVHTVHAAGRSNGYSDALVHLISLANTCDPESVRVQVEGAERPRTEIEEIMERISP